ncbi:hypothetical protein BC828DRAFT_87609 [Blastocladiella britannica]|nr:hypothetical protein BC828DRAFT_87609 [Blastocladiella britannica]
MKIVQAMVDTGAPAHFIDESVAQDAGFVLVELEKPRLFSGLDGRPFAHGRVTHVVRAVVSVLGDCQAQPLIAAASLDSPTASMTRNQRRRYHKKRKLTKKKHLSKKKTHGSSVPMAIATCAAPPMMPADLCIHCCEIELFVTRSAFPVTRTAVAA